MEMAVDTFRKENQEISDLCKILSVLVNDPDFHCNSVTCELLSRFIERVDAHLSNEGKMVYSDLLQQHDKALEKVASQFLSNTHELRKLFTDYNKKWRRTSQSHSDPKDREGFIKESREIFRLMGERIAYENEKIFPFLQPAH